MNLKRKVLVISIVVLAVLQVGILAYLGVLLWPAPPAPDEVAQATPVPGQFQLPSAADDTPASDVPGLTATPVPAAVAGAPVPASSYTSLARGFDEELALDHIAVLASDELGGRQPGSPGGEAAGDYIADRFAAYGLQPAGEGETYFQTFTVPYGAITAPPVLDVIPPAGETLTGTYEYRTDYRALTGGYVGAGETEGQVVWLSNCGREAYTGQDVVGKIVLCNNTGNPDVYRQAIAHRVGGLLLLDREAETFRRGGYRQTAWVPETLPAYLISEEVGADLLVGTDYTLDDLTLHFTATPLAVSVRMAVEVEEQEEAEARNVLGLLPGSDPAHEDEIVVIGAHYDHLGLEPDGEVMNGANDNASGTAAILEIARLYQAHDFRPARSILFAAWDGEEQGLLGSRYYVEHPLLPITQTVALLNLDMVGAGEVLQIDGEPGVAGQMALSADVYNVTTTISHVGRSDHVSFYEAGVDGAMFIYWPDPVYHSPADEVSNVEPGKLRAAGVLSAHTLAALADGQVQLEQVVEHMEAAIATGDREGFLAFVDPADPGLRTAQAAWFDNLWSRELEDVRFEPDGIRIGDGLAEVDLTVSYRWGDTARREPPVSYDVRFVERDGVWAFAGYRLESVSAGGITVGRLPDVPRPASDLFTTTHTVVHTLADDLGWEVVSGTRFILYPNAAALRSVARPAAQDEIRWLVPAPDVAELVWSEPVTPAVASLALQQMGIPDGAAPWLREGLALRYEEGVERDLLSLLVATDPISPLMTLPDPRGLPGQQAQVVRAYGWSATRYLLERYGPAGLRELGAAWAESEDVETAFRRALGVTPAQFEDAWRRARLEPLRADAAAIHALLEQRTQAVIEGDEGAFMATITSADPVLRTEERHWFADLAEHPVEGYAVEGELIDWTPGGDELHVLLRVGAALQGSRSSQVSYDARFVREGRGWRYAGVVWNELVSEHFVLHYQEHDAAWAARVLELAEEAYDQVTTDLDAEPPLPVHIKAYEQPELFRTSVLLSLPEWATGWTEPGESIKFRVRDTSDLFFRRLLTHELAHQVLFAQGLEDPWLHEGIACYESGQVVDLGMHWAGGRYWPTVQEAVRRHDELPLDALPSFEDLPDDQVDLAYAQSWSMVAYVVEEHGMSGLQRLLERAIAGEDFITAVRTALSLDREAFHAGWREYALTAGVPEESVALAQDFDAQHAMLHVRSLAGPAFAGREAGTEGAERAAAYIADQFADVGLQPLGDPLTTTASSPRGYLQHFPISTTHLLDLPALTLLDEGGRALASFTYRSDFLESGGQGVAEGGLVWLRGGRGQGLPFTTRVEDLRFGGNIVVERGVEDPVARAAQLQALGASGLIVVTDKEPDDLQATHVRFDPTSEVDIPVFELTEPAFERLLEQVGLTPRDLVATPPALPLGLEARLELVRTPVTTTHTANVLGYLEGSDPLLADEVIVVGAHYDHIGQAPDGLLFPGANHNASGVAAMLEVARVWQEAGVRPARSVLFAAWGAEEMGGAGVAHYLDDPALPLTRTVGVIALDGLGGGTGYKLLFYGTREHDLALIQPMEAGAAQLDVRTWRRGSAGEGWHEDFRTLGIPTTKLIWDEAERGFYLPGDDAQGIEIDRFADNGQILTLLLSWLAGM